MSSGTYSGALSCRRMMAQKGEEEMKEYKARLIADVTIDQDNIPQYIEISTDMEGNSFSLKQFVVQTDIKTSASYSLINFNNQSWEYSILGPYNNGKTGTLYQISGDVVLVSGAVNRCYVNGGRNDFTANYQNPGPVTKMRIASAANNIVSGTFLKIWELTEE